MESVESTCTRCGNAIRNCADSGRPDDWYHHDLPPGQDHEDCYATPPNDVEAALPRTTRRMRVKVQELVTYQVDMEVPMHAGVSGDQLVFYLEKHDDLWAEQLSEETIIDTSDREVDIPGTYYLDDEGYLEALDGNLYAPRVKKWLTVSCPVCGQTPSEGDTAHQAVTYEHTEDPEPKTTEFVAIACDGSRVVNPNALHMPIPWKDWTENTPNVQATEK
ncbi:hypothetical protein AB0K21_21640 [Streptosporangium sp. NPDC049248]|uniref:hypothetical protein n=1 Tax=Streptosporangium sp. NPDC049248 TaxID=3155651 RepID=UPI00342F6983